MLASPYCISPASMYMVHMGTRLNKATGKRYAMVRNMA